MNADVHEFLPLAAKIAREFGPIPGLSFPDIAAMGFSGLDTLGLLKSGCGVPPQAVREASSAFVASAQQARLPSPSPPG
jgi:hypothetical protein